MYLWSRKVRATVIVLQVLAVLLAITGVATLALLYVAVSIMVDVCIGREDKRGRT